MKNTTVETQNGIDGTIKPGVIKPLIFNSTTASERRPALPPPIEPAPINRSAAAPAPFSATRQQQTALQQFHANASDYFADVVPPQLSEFHLQNSRMVPTRDHILPLMPKGGICAEVGTQTGGFAKLILSVLQPSKLHIYDIDYTVFDRAHFASAIQNGMVELHQGDSSSLLGQLPDQHFDFIYVDGDHSYEGVVRDLAVAARKIKDDGWIVCNDYTLYSPLEKTKYGVYRAVNELCLNQGFEIVYLGLHKWGYHDVALRKANAASPSQPPVKHSAGITQNGTATEPANTLTAIRNFYADAAGDFAEVMPPQLTELHLRNCRVLPSRDHILQSMPTGGICAEIGTQTGDFAKLIQSIMQPAKLHIYDIDYTAFDHAHFASAMEKGIVELHEGDSSTLLGEMSDRHFDFIYIDGDHTYDGIVKDLMQSAKKIKHDGWIVCNDYTLYSPLEKTKYGVYRAVNEFCLSQGFEIVHLGLHPFAYHDVAMRRFQA